MSDQDIPIFLSVGIDPIEPGVTVLGFAKSKDESNKQIAERATDNFTYRKAFHLTQMKELHSWLIDCGVPKHEAKNVMRQLGKSIEKVVDAMA